MDIKALTSILVSLILYGCSSKVIIDLEATSQMNEVKRMVLDRDFYGAKKIVSTFPIENDEMVAYRILDRGGKNTVTFFPKGVILDYISLIESYYDATKKECGSIEDSMNKYELNNLKDCLSELYFDVDDDYHRNKKYNSVTYKYYGNILAPNPTKLAEESPFGVMSKNFSNHLVGIKSILYMYKDEDIKKINLAIENVEKHEKEMEKKRRIETREKQKAQEERYRNSPKGAIEDACYISKMIDQLTEASIRGAKVNYQLNLSTKHFFDAVSRYEKASGKKWSISLCVD